METTLGDFKIAACAAGFTLGFGFLTVWNAIKQTRNVKSPLRSTYVILVWLEIFGNLGIGIIGWLILEGILPLNVPVLFCGLVCWVLEIQCLMQIIINRIYVVAERQDQIIKIKWITAGVITVINIAVFNIWIPAHIDPPPNQTYVNINKYWDRTSKVLICLVDAALNIMFLRIVQQRLVRYHGLRKYAALVRFNTRLMVLSVSLDVLLIGLMSLQNQLVYIQFHPVTYMVKLNIELTMAALIAKLARANNGYPEDFVVPLSSHEQNSLPTYINTHQACRRRHYSSHGELQSQNTSGDLEFPMQGVDDSSQTSKRRYSSDIETIKEVTTTVHVTEAPESDADLSGSSYPRAPGEGRGPGVTAHSNTTTVESSGPHQAPIPISRFSSMSDKSRDRNSESAADEQEPQAEYQGPFAPPAPARVHQTRFSWGDDGSIV